MDDEHILATKGWGQFRHRVRHMLSHHPVISHDFEQGASFDDWDRAFKRFLDWAAKAGGYNRKAQRSGVSLRHLLEERDLLDSNVILLLTSINAIFMELETDLRGPVEHKSDTNCDHEMKEEREQESQSQGITHVQDLYRAFQSAISHLWEACHDLVMRSTKKTRLVDPSYSLTEHEYNTESLDEFMSSETNDASGPPSGQSQLGDYMDYERSDEQKPVTGEHQLGKPANYEASNEREPDTREPQLEESMDYDASDENESDS